MADFLNPDPYAVADYSGDRALAQPQLFPDFGLGDSGRLLAQAASSFLGGMPMGWNNPNNLYSNYAAQQKLTQHNKRMQSMAAMDADKIQGFARSAMRLADMDPTEKKNADLLTEIGKSGSNAFGFVSGMFLNTDAGARALDRYSGGAWQMPVNKFISDFGRRAYDPLTGSYGYSDDTVARTSKHLMDVYSGENRATRGAGLSAGTIGELTRELGSRGFIGGPEAGLTGEKAMASQMTNIKRALDDKVKAVTALKEIFGGAGEPDAPLAKLLNALEAMTGGSQQISGKRLEGVVRGIKNAADTAGIGLQQASAFLDMNSKLLTSQGLNAAFAAPITQSQMLTHAALGQTGALQTSSWGLLNQAQLSGLQASQEMRATGSTTANLLGAVSRLKSQGQTMTGGQDAKLLQQFATEAEAGIIGPATKAMAGMDAAKQTQLLASSFGISARSAEARLQARDANMEQIYGTNAQQHVAMMQVLEFGNVMRATTGGKASHYLTASGMKDVGRADKLGKDLAGHLYETTLNMSNAERNDNTKRSAALQKAARTYLQANGGADAAKLAGDDKALLLMTDEIYDSMNEAYKRSNGVSLNNFLTLNAPEVRAARAANERRNKIIGSMESSVAGANQSAGMRLADALLSYGQKADTSGVDVILKTLNIKDDKRVNEDTKKMFVGLMDARQKLYGQFFKDTGELKEGVSQKQAEEGLKLGMGAINKQLEGWAGKDKDRKAFVEELIEKQRMTDKAAGGASSMQLTIAKLVLKAAGGKELDLGAAESDETEAKPAAKKAAGVDEADA